jgi:hypothetical protein
MIDLNLRDWLFISLGKRNIAAVDGDGQKVNAHWFGEEVFRYN